jgi:D-glucosaminate-6-phosphate ammonia-lyase
LLDISTADPYGSLGVPRVVSCMGPVTILGGLPLSESVVEAMRLAARSKVNLNELNARAGRRIAELIGAQAAFVTTGAAAGWQLAAAACLAGSDPQRIARLPEVLGERREIVIHRKHRCNFDHALRSAGAELVNFGYSRDRTERWELEAAISDRTAAVAYVDAFGDQSVLTLEEVTAIAHEHDVPVIVDAAPSLPPASKLQTLPATGADLCSFSGGKDLGGPQNTGFVVGRPDLVAACALNSNPNHNTIGRAFKVNAEAIVGLVTALEEYLARDPEADTLRWLANLEEIAGRLDSSNGPSWSIEPTTRHGMPVPCLNVVLGGAPAAERVSESLRKGDPQIWVGVERETVVINPQALHADDVDLVGERLQSAIQQSTY